MPTLTSALPPAARPVRDRFERLLEDDFERGQFRRYGWQARAVFSKVRDFWSDLIPEGLPKQTD